MNQSDFAFSLHMRDLMTRIAQETVNRLRPPYRYGRVESIDRPGRKCGVVLNGDTAPVLVSMGAIQPSAVDQIVRVEGIGTDKFISDVIGTTYYDASGGINTRIANGKLASAAPTSYPTGYSSASVIESNGWPDEGTVHTLVHEVGSNYASQIFVNRVTAATSTRASTDGATWSNWRISGGTLPYRQSIMNAATQPISSSTWTGITYINEAIEGFGTATFSSETRITTPGLYILHGQCAFAVNGTGNRGARFLVNDSAVGGTRLIGASGQSFPDVTRIMRLEADDYLKFQLFQSSGGSLDVVKANNGFATYYSVAMIGY